MAFFDQNERTWRFDLEVFHKTKGTKPVSWLKATFFSKQTGNMTKLLGPYDGHMPFEEALRLIAVQATTER